MGSIFLTGGTGFIGSRLLDILLENGEDVTVLTRSRKKKKRLEKKGAKASLGNIIDGDSLLTHMEGHDTVFHLAALFKFGGRAWDEFYSTNVLGTKNVLECAKEYQMRVVYCSTVAHFGSTGGKIRDESFTRESPYLTYYSKSKSIAHELCLEHIKNGREITIVSPGAVFGKGDTSQLGKAVNSYLNGDFTVLPDTEGRFAYVHVDDVAKAFLLAWKRGEIGREYIIGDKIMTIKNYFEKIGDLAGIEPPPTIPTGLVKLVSSISELASKISGNPPELPMEGLRMLENDWAFSSERARNELGWEPKPFERRLRSYINNIRDES